MGVELIIATFDEDETEAVKFLERLRELRASKSLVVERATAVTRTADGEVQVENLSGKETRRGAVYGALTGGLVGLLGGPVTGIIGAVAGAAGGDALSDVRDKGVPDSLIKEIRGGLKDGSSALIVYAQSEWSQRAVNRLEEAGATVVHDPVSLQVRPPTHSSG